MLKPRDGAIGFQDRGGSKMHHTRSLLLDVNVLAVLIHATCPNVDRVQESLGSFRVSGDLFQWSPLCCPLMVILRGETGGTKLVSVFVGSDIHPIRVSFTLLFIRNILIFCGTVQHFWLFQKGCTLPVSRDHNVLEHPSKAKIS